MRAAIYARIGTDNQNERSPDDQVADCRRYAGAQGWEAPDELVFIDRAISAPLKMPKSSASRAALGGAGIVLPRLLSRFRSLALAATALLASQPAFAELTFEIVKSFDRGFQPGALVVASDGALYGTTGDYTFRIDASGTFTSLSPMSGSAVATWVRGDGALFGIATGYGAAILRVDASGAVSTLHTFDQDEGVPQSVPTENGSYEVGVFRRSDGSFYGVTGGGQAPGSIFRVTAAGAFQSVHSFSAEDGPPSPMLVRASDDSFYGITSGNNATTFGTIFRIDSAGNFTTVHSFTAAEGGISGPAIPYYYHDVAHPLVVGSDGALYGATRGDGESSFGSIFRIDRAGAFSTVHPFPLDDVNACPYASNVSSTDLIVGGDGALYGLHAHGSDYVSSYFGCRATRTAFRLDSTGGLTTLHTFDMRDIPQAPLTRGADGAFYGFSNSATGSAALFRLDTAGALTLLHEFPYGEYLQTALVAGSDGALYGATNSSIFRIDRAATFAPVHSFTADDGAPSFPLVR